MSTPSIGWCCQRDAEAPSDAGEPVAPPAVTKRDGDREHARPQPRRYAIQVPHQPRKEVVRVEFVDDQLQECAGPRELRRASGERPDCARAKLLPPSLGLPVL
jgi:hypothetical protein